ncbi:hypothetical protein [Streptomyces europaeiscabiei]|uniref:hypothetical protein n=1 Tax=Streptomyces europaeiscabiei TaxID=146819 RepID=UPI0038F62992
MIPIASVENALPASVGERLIDDTTYGLVYREGEGDWHHLRTPAVIRNKDEATDIIADLEALSISTGVEYRMIEIRHTATVLPPTIPAPADVEPGPVAAQKLRSGDRVILRGTERLVWKTVYRRVGHCLRIHTVPPDGQNPDYYAFTLTPGEDVELIERGPAVDVNGQPLASS